MADKFPDMVDKSKDYPKRVPPAEGEPLNVRGGTYPHVKGDPLNPRPGHGPKVDPKPEIAPPWAYPQDGDPDVVEFEPGVDALLPFKKDADPDDPRYPKCDPNNSSRPNPIDPNPPTDDERKRDPNKRFYAKSLRRDRLDRPEYDFTASTTPTDHVRGRGRPELTSYTSPTEPYFPR